MTAAVFHIVYTHSYELSCRVEGMMCSQIQSDNSAQSMITRQCNSIQVMQLSLRTAGKLLLYQVHILLVY